MDNRAILLVDNSRVTRCVMGEMARGFGVDLDLAQSGAEARAMLARRPERYAFVLMELDLPDASGLDTVSLIRRDADERCAAMPIVAFTGDTRFHDHSRICRFGMDDFAKKPVTPGQLLGLIDKYCNAA